MPINKINNGPKPPVPPHGISGDASGIGQAASGTFEGKSVAKAGPNDDEKFLPGVAHNLDSSRPPKPPRRRINYSLRSPSSRERLKEGMHSLGAALKSKVRDKFQSSNEPPYDPVAPDETIKRKKPTKQKKSAKPDESEYDAFPESEVAMVNASIEEEKLRNKREYDTIPWFLQEPHHSIQEPRRNIAESTRELLTEESNQAPSLPPREALNDNLSAKEQCEALLSDISLYINDLSSTIAQITSEVRKSSDLNKLSPFDLKVLKEKLDQGDMCIPHYQALLFEAARSTETTDDIRKTIESKHSELGVMRDQLNLTLDKIETRLAKLEKPKNLNKPGKFASNTPLDISIFNAVDPVQAPLLNRLVILDTSTASISDALNQITSTPPTPIPNTPDQIQRGAARIETPEEVLKFRTLQLKSLLRTMDNETSAVIQLGADIREAIPKMSHKEIAYVAIRYKLMLTERQELRDSIHAAIQEIKNLNIPPDEHALDKEPA